MRSELYNSDIIIIGMCDTVLGFPANMLAMLYEIARVGGCGDHNAVFGCLNDRRYSENQVVLPYVDILQFYSPKSKKKIF